MIGRAVATAESHLGRLSQISQLPVADLVNDPPEPGAIETMLTAVGRDYGAIGYRIDGRRLMVAFADPPDAEDLQSWPAASATASSPFSATPWPSTGSSAPATTAPVRRPATVPDRPPAQPDQRIGAGTRVGNVGTTMPLHLDDLLRYASVGASDLHLTAGMPGCIRLHGAVRPIEGCPQLDNETIREMIFGVLTGRPCGKSSRPKRSSTPRTRSPAWGASG